MWIYDPVHFKTFAMGLVLGKSEYTQIYFCCLKLAPSCPVGKCGLCTNMTYVMSDTFWTLELV